MSSEVYGGGLFQGMAVNCTFVSNTVYYSGGGMYDGLSSNCLFVGNVAAGGPNHGGGGVSEGHHYDGFFTQNLADRYGGAAFQSDLYDCIISNNHCDNGAGVAYSYLSNSLITHNITSLNGGDGYYCDLTDCVVQWNLAGTNQAGHWYGLGGGMYGGSALNTTFTRNKAYVRGGGALQVALTNCIVSHNVATNETDQGQGQSGGCAACTVVGGAIVSNKAQTGGGACYSTLIDVLLESNEANVSSNYISRGHGGGAYMSQLTNCVVRKNEVYYGGHGGGLYDCTATRCYISYNNCRMQSGYGYLGSGLGGGAYRGAVSNCVIYNNAGQGAGGGVASGRVVHCTIVDNYSSSWAGGGVFGCTVENSIVYSNQFREGGYDVDNHSESVMSSSCTYPASEGNISVDPLFVADDALFRLQTNSPCIDAATNSPCNEDYSRTARPLDGDNDGEGRWDIGAHEYVHPSADTDHDGMNDAWELQYMLDLIANDADLDEDGDRFGNYAEWKAGTDPTDIASFLGLVEVAASGSGMSVSWSSVAGRTYSLQRNTQLSSNTWDAFMSGVNATPPMNTVTDSDASDSAMYIYRIQVE